MKLSYYVVPLIITVMVGIVACNSPMQSQKFFIKAVNDDPILEPIHQTALYTIFFDHALRRCVLHSSYTWGESGGGTGGTGLGVTVFNCNPQALKAHVENLRQQIDDGTDYFELPVRKMRKSTTPTRQKKTLQPSPVAPKHGLDKPTQQPLPTAPPVSSPTPSSVPEKPNRPQQQGAPPLTAAPNAPEKASNSTAGGTTNRTPSAAPPPKAAPLQPIYQP